MVRRFQVLLLLFAFGFTSNNSPINAVALSPGQRGEVGSLHVDIAAGLVTRRQHLERRIDVIQHQERMIRAFIDTDLASARQTANERDRKNGAVVVGPLDGVVIAIKDNMHADGFRTTAGSTALAKVNTIQMEAGVVRRLREAGAIIVGTTNLDTNARGVRGLSEVRGQTANPRDPRFNAGGSSAGSAATVASGMVDVSLGSDTCGSLRYPASSVGIYSLRPTQGRVSRSGLVPLSPSQDTVGPMALHPDDLRQVLSVIEGIDPQDPLTVAIPHEPVAPRRRVGVLKGVGSANAMIVSELKAAGFAVITGFDAPSVDGVNLIEVEFRTSYNSYVKWRKAGGDSAQLWLTKDGPDRSAYRLEAIRKGNIARLKLAGALTTVLEGADLDALILPTNRYAPVRLGQRQPSGNCIFSAGSGLPALTIPDASLSGLPAVGIDLLGRAGDDNLLIDIAEIVDGRR